MDFVNLRFCKLVKSVASVVAVLVLSGCGSEQLQFSDGTEVELLRPADVSIPSYAASSDLMLDFDGGIVQVGQDIGIPFKGGFAKPVKSTVLSELPPVVDEGFVSRGWETPERHFSVVGKDDRLILAVDHWNSIPADRANGIWQSVIVRVGEPETLIKTEHLQYGFWNDGLLRLMVVLDSGGSQMRLTQAVGVSTLMDSLRMNSERAREDSAKAEEQYLKIAETLAKKGSSNK